MVRIEHYWKLKILLWVMKMSKYSYTEIRNSLNRMLDIEFDSSIKDMKNVYFFIDDENNKLMVKNYDESMELVDCIGWYLNVNDYEYIQQFQYLYSYNEYELIEFDLEVY